MYDTYKKPLQNDSEKDILYREEVVYKVFVF